MGTKKNIKICELFVKLCKKIFKFLEIQYGFKIYEIKFENYGTFITYKNSTTAISISLEERDGGVFVDMSRLINDNIPEMPIFIERNTKLNTFDLEDVLLFKKPSLKVERPTLDELLFNKGRESVLKKTLIQHSDALKKYATDILEGDFSSFKKLEKIVKAR